MSVPNPKILLSVFLATAAVVLPADARVIATNPAAESVTAVRIAALPADRRGAWVAYLAASEAAARRDRATLAAERKPGVAVPPPPATGNGVLTMPLDRDAFWYAGAEARRIADVILSFQTPAGGWGKNQPRTGEPRVPGQSFVIGGSADPVAGVVPAESWHYVGTIDNGATTTEIRFLARVAARAGGAGAAYRTGVERGVRYLLNAQYPNGGWPQIWPLEGGYHDAVTLNDDAMADVLDLMSDVGAGKGDFAVVPPAMRAQATAAAARGIACILKMQVVVGGRPTGWGQQHDALTLRITSARNYEPPALAAPESAGVLRYLMRQPDQSPRVRAAVEAGIAWLRATAIAGQAWRDAGDGVGKRLIADPAAPPLWARFYLADGNRPVFGDRDKTIHDDVMELSTGRRRGYAWYGTSPNSALEAYAKWRKR